MELMDFLQTNRSFAGFTQPELRVLERALRVDRFSADHVLLKEGRKGHAVYILMEGEVQISHTQKIGRGLDDLGTLKPGDVFGTQSIIVDLPRYSTCRAVTPVTVASLPQTAFNLLYNSHVALAEHFQYLLACQLVRELRQLDKVIVASTRHGEIEPLAHIL